MKNIKHKWLLALLVIGLFSSAAQARLALDTVEGLPNSSPPLTLVLDSNDFVAAELSLGAGEIITSIQAYINAGTSGNPNDQFTFHLYSADGSNGLPGTDNYSVTATYLGDGWNGLSNLSYSVLTTGNYWLALEVGTEAHDTAGLQLPGFSTAGSVPALGYAFNAGTGYTSMSQNFGLQVTAVPEPAAAWLFGTGLFGLTFRRRRKVNTL